MPQGCRKLEGEQAYIYAHDRRLWLCCQDMHGSLEPLDRIEMIDEFGVLGQCRYISSYILIISLDSWFLVEL